MNKSLAEQLLSITESDIPDEGKRFGDVIIFPSYNVEQDNKSLYGYVLIVLKRWGDMDTTADEQKLNDFARKTLGSKVGSRKVVVYTNAMPVKPHHIGIYLDIDPKDVFSTHKIDIGMIRCIAEINTVGK